MKTQASAILCTMIVGGSETVQTGLQGWQGHTCMNYGERETGVYHHALTKNNCMVLVSWFGCFYIIAAAINTKNRDVSHIRNRDVLVSFFAQQRIFTGW